VFVFALTWMTAFMADQPPPHGVLSGVLIIGLHLRPGTLVVLESTSYPGAEDVIRPILERSGLVAGRCRATSPRPAAAPTWSPRSSSRPKEPLQRRADPPTGHQQ
jgi:hypothetical protein